MVKECWSQQESTPPLISDRMKWRLCGASVAFVRRISGVCAAHRPQMFNMNQAFDKKRQGPVGRRSPVQCNHTPNKSLKMRLLSFSRPILAACAGLVNPATLR